MKVDQKKLVEALRSDGRTHTAERIAAMSPAAFTNRVFNLAFRHAADLIHV